MTFQSLNLIPPLLRAVEDMGYTEPSPIQQAAIRPILEGRDLVGCAQTGTGKTAAFAIPLLQLLHERAIGGNRPIRALILTPTRELALQIDDNIEQYGEYLRLRHLVIFGGVGQNPQVEGLRRGVDILTATPGRLNDLCNQGFIDLSKIEFFVLDEADRMLDMGFIHDVRKVIARLPPDRQTLLFSATMPREIEELSQKILRKPVRVAVTPVASTVDAIEQRLYKVDKGNKKHLLLHILQDRDLRSILVFTNTKHRANRLAKELADHGVTAAAIHGNKSQSARVAALEQFKAGTVRVLVATDIAARGIDVSELSCVVNYELPNVPETYVHRIGRTGRAGHGGLAVSFCNVDELPYLKDIEKLIGKAVPEVVNHPWPMAIFEPTPKQPRQPRPPRAEQNAPKVKSAAEPKKPAPEAGRSAAAKQQRAKRQDVPKAPPAPKAAPKAPGVPQPARQAAPAPRSASAKAAAGMARDAANQPSKPAAPRARSRRPEAPTLSPAAQEIKTLAHPWYVNTAPPAKPASVQPRQQPVPEGQKKPAGRRRRRPAKPQ